MWKQPRNGDCDVTINIFIIQVSLGSKPVSIDVISLIFSPKCDYMKQNFKTIRRRYRKKNLFMIPGKERISYIDTRSTARKEKIGKLVAKMKNLGTLK